MGTPPDSFEDASTLAYRQWQQRLFDSLETDFSPYDPSEDVQNWLRAVHRDNGDLPVDHLAPLVLARRARIATAVTAAIRAAFMADGRRDLAVPVLLEPPSPELTMGRVQVGDQEIQGLDPQDIAVQAGDGFQTYVADVRALIWPVCRTHNNGAHPRIISATAVWQCPATGHVIGSIDPAARNR
ncbi:hypothetical protein [Actinacidiphila acididurans]|uniref:Uncharacterized protein n=1 Tax=Actinacidiphila acididurans TaxID=2784346 RepID=A0ABS2U1L3_9ACTN|nr:hypothetical protein [Actinacidiphila acididurans]MBM9509492.1 hypothetical protein [Actinacidiphila acididurans]